jgi:hypothetical protein
VEADDEILLLLGEAAPLEVRPQVVDPSQPAALTASLQAYTYQNISIYHNARASELATAGEYIPSKLSIIFCARDK